MRTLEDLNVFQDKLKANEKCRHDFPGRFFPLLRIIEIEGSER